MLRINLQTALLSKSIFAVALCAASPAFLPAQDQPKAGADESWTKTSEDAPQHANPARTTESHSRSGNRTVDKQKIEVRGINGGYQPSSETETETIQVDANTTRTIVRTYQWNSNGRRTLARVAEQESRASASGAVHTDNKISAADLNGAFQLIRREVADTKTVSPGVEETKSTVYQRDSYGGFSQTAQTKELTTHNADDSFAVKKTTLQPDGNGGWQVTGVTEKTIQSDGKDRITNERVSSSDINGNLSERLRTVSKEGENAAGEKTSTVETYSVTGPGYNDGSSGLTRRVTTLQKKDANGETTEQQIDEPGYGNPSDGAKPAGRVHYVVKYAAPGSQQPTQQTKTVESRDASGNYNSVATETQKSTQPPPQPSPKPKPEAQSAKPQEKPPVKP